MTKIVLAISFIFLLGRMIYAGIGAVTHHQEKRLIPLDHTTTQTIPPRDPPPASH
ncbi:MULTISPECIES: YfgG family protein [Yersiniaceae]